MEYKYIKCIFSEEEELLQEFQHSLKDPINAKTVKSLKNGNSPYVSIIYNIMEDNFILYGHTTKIETWKPGLRLNYLLHRGLALNIPMLFQGTGEEVFERIENNAARMRLLYKTFNNLQEETRENIYMSDSIFLEIWHDFEEFLTKLHFGTTFEGLSNILKRQKLMFIDICKSYFSSPFNTEDPMRNWIALKGILSDFLEDYEENQRFGICRVKRVSGI